MLVCICFVIFYCSCYITNHCMQEALFLSMLSYHMDNTLSTSTLLSNSLPHLFYSALKPWESKTEETAKKVRNIHKHKWSKEIGYLVYCWHFGYQVEFSHFGLVKETCEGH